MLNEVEYMHKNGLALGGSINNAIVVDNGKILNPDGLRFKDEFVRHKILDLCGDIYLSGHHLMGDIVAKCAGHEVNDKFSGMINAFSYGAPPHGGIAPGIDRIVMLLAGKENIREVTLFPMNQNAQDLMMQAPSDIDDKQLKELNIRKDIKKS